MTQNILDTLQTGAVFADLAPLGLIAFSGEDTATYLQGQLTNDVRKLAAGAAQYSGFCSPKGRLLASFLLWNQDGATYMQLAGDLQEAIQKRLSMFILRSKVKARDARPRGSAHRRSGQACRPADRSTRRRASLGRAL